MRHIVHPSNSAHPVFLKILFFIVLLSGIFLITITTVQFKKRSFSELTDQGIRTLEAIKSADIKDLSFTSSDTSNADYNDLCQRLRSICQTYTMLTDDVWKYTSIYCMTKRNDSLIVGPTGSTIDNFQKMKPGTVHRLGDNKLSEVFSGKQIIITRPYINNYGSFLSVVLPLINHAEKTAQQVLVLDIETSQWNKFLFHSCIPPLLVTIFLLLIVIVFSFPGIIRKIPFLSFPEVQFTIVTGLLLTLSISFLTDLKENSLRNETFYHLARSETSLITDEISDIDEIRFDNFASFFENSKEVDSNEFKDYTRHLILDSNVHEWGWIPVISDSLRTDLNYHLENNSSLPSGIWQFDSLGRKCAVTKRYHYYPIMYTTLNNSNSTLGFDMGSDTLFLNALRSATTTGTTQSTVPFHRSVQNGNDYSMYSFQAILSKSDRRLRGFTFFSLDYSTLLRFSSVHPATQSQLSTIALLDLNPDTPPNFIGSSTNQAVNTGHSKPLKENSLLHLSFIHAFGRTYALAAYPTRQFRSYYHILNSSIIFFAGFILTIILSILFGSLKSHETVLEKRVLERTAELKESEERFAQIAEQCGEIIWEVDNKGVYTYISKACNLLTGYTDSEILNKMHIYELRPAESSEMFRKLFSDSLNHKAPISNVQTQLRTKDNKLLTVLTNGVPVQDCNGVVKGFRGSDLDITGIKDAELEKEKLQIELLQSQKMDSIGRLAGGIAHDFNNMLCAISGNAEIGLDTTTQEEITHIFNDILDATQRSSDLTFQLLAFARKQTINPTVISLNDSISLLYKMLKRLIGENIDLKWIPGKELWSIKIDRSQIDQLLANLVVNARDAITGTGQITIETENVIFTKEYCSTQFESRPGNYVMIAVSDTGCGMDKQTLEHLFEPFFTTKALGHGTGLGLATVYGIVKQNRGFIHVYSEPSQGTSFRIYLPQHEKEDSLQPVKSNNNQLITGTETILVVEDEESILEFCSTMLKRCGYTVFTAATPASALTTVHEQKRIDLLLTDVIMPEMNGKELLRKAQEIFPDLKCVYMSGYTANVIAHHGILDEGINFIHKPFTKAVLMETIRNVLDQKVNI